MRIYDENFEQKEIRRKEKKERLQQARAEYDKQARLERDEERSKDGRNAIFMHCSFCGLNIDS